MRETHTHQQVLLRTIPRHPTTASRYPILKSSQDTHQIFSMARQWILNSQEGFENSLEYQENVKVPAANELGPYEVLVKMRAISLNYRELVIAGPAVSLLLEFSSCLN
jgi:hypothetical protein